MVFINTKPLILFIIDEVAKIVEINLAEIEDIGGPKSDVSF